MSLPGEPGQSKPLWVKLLWAILIVVVAVIVYGYWLILNVGKA